MKKPKSHFTFNGYYVLVQQYTLRKIIHEITTMPSSEKESAELQAFPSYKPMKQKKKLSNPKHPIQYRA
jgi:hypothetical protein